MCVSSALVLSLGFLLLGYTGSLVGKPVHFRMLEANGVLP